MKLRKTADTAFTLVEVTLALGVAGFCLSALLGLLSLGVTSNQSSSEQTVSSAIAKAVMADLRATPSGAQSSPRFGFNVPAGGALITTGSAAAYGNPQTLFLRQDSSPSTSGTVGGAAVAGQSRYRVTVAFYPAANQLTAAGVRILVTWPALADRTTTTWPVNFTGSYEVLTALDRN
jgi:type II secretory pathway pseudopilin PulG